MSTVYLRQFPGKSRFEKVSKDDWGLSLPLKDIAGFGHIGRLEADVRVWAPDGELLAARKWQSKSYIRNFARILRGFFGQNVQLVDRQGTLRTVAIQNAPGVGNVALVPQVNQETVNAGSVSNPDMSGAGFAIGNGVASEQHTRNDLVARVGGIYSSRQNVRATVLNAATTTIEVTTGITNGQATTINVTEIGLFLFAMILGVGPAAVPFSTLMAYDGIASTPVASGGVIAPRYTMDFPV
jgi:hypothetical protein